ncbi:hypothetical protein P3W24_03505 [Luteibacter sp. PPL201]|uniref:Uncharacterized protein n=2 Tax=Luteibacter sahnii TaxID=3021977 RepID=A0ABT6B7I6_9GAMM
MDALLVLDPPIRGDEKLGEGPERTVLILVREACGSLREASANRRVVPCAHRGGVAGDPFGYVKLEPRGFTVVNGGGSRERWSDEFTFIYAADHDDWFVDKVSRQVSDSETGLEKRIELSPEELGRIAFEDFDPEKVPEVTLP